MIVERAIELLEVIAGAQDRVAARRCLDVCGVDEPFGGSVEAERRIVVKPAEHGRAVLGEPLVVLEPIEL